MSNDNDLYYINPNWPAATRRIVPLLYALEQHTGQHHGIAYYGKLVRLFCGDHSATPWMSQAKLEQHLRALVDAHNSTARVEEADKP